MTVKNNIATGIKRFEDHNLQEYIKKKTVEAIFLIEIQKGK